MNIESPIINRKKNRWFLPVVIVVLVVIGALIAFDFVKYDFFPKRFGVVDAGLVYRSGQLSPHLVERVLKQYHIQTIIDLQSKQMNPARDSEQKAVHDLKINYYRYGLSGDGTGKIEHYADALQTLVESKKAGKPVLIHCSAGTQRTGVAIAYYQMLVEHKSAATALQEMEKYGWSLTRDEKTRKYINDHMAQLANLLVARGVIAHAPDPLPQLGGAPATR